MFQGRFLLKWGSLQPVLVAFCVGVLDLYTKFFAASMLSDAPELVLLPFLNFVDVRNKGMSFGLFGGYSLANFFFLLVNVAVMLVVLLCSFREKHLFPRVAWGFILGGGIGNTVDRIFFGAVRDFIDVHFFGFHWPAFNFADGAIFFGVLFMIVSLCFRGGVFFPQRRL